MKRVFEKPVMNVELFVANQAVSSCTVHGQGVSYKFDCMYGPNVDTANVISTMITGVEANCKTAIGYASGVSVARDYCRGMSHSNNNSSRATWQKWNGSYLQVSYTGAAGMLYTDGDSSTDAKVWSVQEGYVKHSSDRGGQHHMVAPVIDPNNMSSSW